MSVDHSPQLVVFTCGGEEYALPIDAVQEIIHYEQPRSVASEAAWIRGVISLRGKIVPVFDLAARMGLDEALCRPSKIVVVDAAAGPMGVIVDEVAEVLTIGADQFETVPSADRDSIEAIAKVGDRLVVLLNPGLFALPTVTTPTAQSQSVGGRAVAQAAA
jgi:purine-binding chemotaxis protein CheW